MHAFQFLKTVTADKSNMLERLLKVLDDNAIRYCIIGGIAVSAYVEPVASLDFDLVITSYQLGRFESLLVNTFSIKRTPRLIEITAANSKLRVNIFTETRYADFVERAEVRNVFDLQLPVATVQDVMRGKIWLYEDVTRKPSKRLADLADISRLLENNPKLRSQVPQAVLQRIEMLGA